MVALSYDDNAFSFFVITLLVLYLIPATWYIVSTILNFRSAPKAAHAARTKAEADKLDRLAREEKAGPDGKPLLWTRSFRIIVGVTVFLALLCLVLILRAGDGTELAQYDPYNILKIKIGASEREIKMAYRKLSLYYHPDKPTGNAEMFQQIAKAYEALTDPIARENYEKYGNPDGRQALEVSIGLPHWLTEGPTKWLFLASYMAVLVIAVPALMFYCYRTGRALGPGGLRPATFEWLKFRLRPDTTVKNLPEIVAGAEEFGALPVDAAVDSEELRQLGTVMLTEGRMTRPSNIDRSVIEPLLITRGSLLLHAHMNRKEVKSKTLQAALSAMLGKSDAILNMLLELSVLRTQAPPQQRIPPHLEAAWAVLEFQQQMTQGLYYKDSSLRQVLPEKTASYVSQLPKKAGGVATLLQWLKMPADTRPGLSDLTEAERAEVTSVAGDLPCLGVDVSVGVLDEEYIAEGDVVTATITLTHENLLARGAAPTSTVPPVYAPFWPKPRTEEWFLFLTSQGDKNLVQFKPVGRGAKPLTAVAVEKLQFLAPERAGRYVYRLHVRSSCYMGLDQVIEVPFEVRPASEVQVEESHEDDAELDGVADVALEQLMGGGGYLDESDTEDEGGEEDGEGNKASSSSSSSSAAAAAASASSKGVTGGLLPKVQATSAAGGAGVSSTSGAGSSSGSSNNNDNSNSSGGKNKGAGASASAGDDDDALPSLAMALGAGGAGGKKKKSDGKKGKKAVATAGGKAAAAAAEEAAEDGDDESDGSDE